MQKKIIRQYYILSCLFSAGGLAIVAGVYVAFLMRNGLDLLQVNLVNASFFLTMFICEIPTGAFADIFGRKKSFILACATMSASMLVYGLSHTFVGFLVAEILAALACTFKTGAFQAWFVDSLKHHGYEGEFNLIFGRKSVLCQVSGALGAIGGSYLYSLDSSYPWFFGGTEMAVVTVVSLLIMREDYFVKKSFSWKEGYSKMVDVTKTSIRYGIDDKAVRFVLLATGIEIFSVQGLNMYWQPFFTGHGVGSQSLGYIFAAIMAMVMFGAWVASRYKSTGQEKRTILIVQVIAGILAIATPLAFGLPMIVTLFLLHEIPRGALDPLIDSYLQKNIPSSERATISSFCASAPDIAGAICLLASGLCAQCFGINATWIMSGLALVVGSIWLGRNGK